MPRLRVQSFGVSLDGFGAGANQGLEHPLGEHGLEMADWLFHTRMWKNLYGTGEAETGIDNEFAERGFDNLGAWIMGRNMFGPVRGPWPDEGWRGWWGEEPPYHCPVFVLTHHPRRSLEMKGGTTFHFVTGGIQSALAQAMAAAGGKDVRLGGGAATIREYLRARLIDELHLAYSPVYLGAGESLLRDIDLRALGYHVARRASGERAMHVVLQKT